MYHTKVSFAGGSHEEAWPRSADFPPPLEGTGSRQQRLGAPVKTAPETACWGGEAVRGQRSPTPPDGKG